MLCRLGTAGGVFKLLIGPDDLGHRGFVFQGGEVADGGIVGHRLDHSPHQLAAASLRQLINEIYFIGLGNRPAFAAYMSRQRLFQFFGRGCPIPFRRLIFLVEKVVVETFEFCLMTEFALDEAFTDALRLGTL